MTELTIICNNVPRPIVESWELTPAERSEFDYIDWDMVERGEREFYFVRYKGEIYDLGDFEVASEGNPIYDAGWRYYISESFFSGILMKYNNTRSGEETVIMGRYYA
jgi:hypothetical protein